MPDDTKIDLSKLNIKENWKKLRQNSFRTFSNGYRLDKIIFNAGMLILFLWFYYVAAHYNFNLNYYECKPLNNLTVYNINCTNPFYKPISWVNYKELPAGEYGNKPTALFNSIYWLPFVIFGLCFLINHLLYNRVKNDKTN